MTSKSAFLAPARRVLSMFYHWRELEKLFDDLKYVPPRDPLELFGVGDYVKKVTGDYHVTGYVVAVFRTHLTRKLRYVVEISAEGGGSFCHIYAPSNLELIKKCADDPAEEIRRKAIAKVAASQITRRMSSSRF